MFDIKITPDNNVYRYHVYDTLGKENSTVGFNCPERAEEYCESMNHRRKLSCCETSLSTNGWHHSSDCKGLGEDFRTSGTETKYRVYSKDNDIVVFTGNGLRKWLCTHGDWEGKESLDNPFTLIIGGRRAYSF